MISAACWYIMYIMHNKSCFFPWLLDLQLFIMLVGRNALGKFIFFLWLGQLFGIGFLKVLSCMSAFCWQTLQKSLIKSVKMWEYRWDHHLAHAFFTRQKYIKVFSPPSQTQIHIWKDGRVLNLLDLIFSLINITLNISVYSAYANQNTLNWHHMMGQLSHLHFLSNDFMLIENKLTSFDGVI